MDVVGACGGGSGSLVPQEDGSVRVQIEAVAICRQAGGSTTPSSFQTIWVPLSDPRTE
jgi:hypothetical protein